MTSAPAMPPDFPNQEESLHPIRKMDAAGQLAGGAAHDFNNLLTGILGNLALLEIELGADAPPTTREKLRSAIKAGERAAKLINQLLGFSRHDVLGTCSCDPSAVTTGSKADSLALTPALPAFESRATPGQPEIILVVDDDELVRQVASTLFTKLGYQVRIATDGAECLRIFAEGKEKIDLVLMDLTMPNLSGQETFRLLRQHHAPVPVLICTGDLLDIESFSKECGVRPEGFVRKPYRLDELAALVRNTLDAWSRQR